MAFNALPRPQITLSVPPYFIAGILVLFTIKTLIAIKFMREVKNRVVSKTPFNFTMASLADAQKYFLQHGGVYLSLNGKEPKGGFYLHQTFLRSEKKQLTFFLPNLPTARAVWTLGGRKETNNVFSTQPTYGTSSMDVGWVEKIWRNPYVL